MKSPANDQKVGIPVILFFAYVVWYDIVKADAEYMKAVFDHLEKMKDNVVIPTGNAGAVSSGMTGTSFSADAVGVGVSAAPVPVINITL